MPKVHRNCGKVESYNGEKLRDGVVRACRAVLTPLGAAEKFAEEVEGKVFAAVEEHISVTSRDIKPLSQSSAMVSSVERSWVTFPISTWCFFIKMIILMLQKSMH